jgi:hypothetical protein
MGCADPVLNELRGCVPFRRPKGGVLVDETSPTAVGNSSRPTQYQRIENCKAAWWLGQWRSRSISQRNPIQR